MRFSSILLVVVACMAVNVRSQLADYIYPYFSQPTYSNYGTVGLIQMPSARMHPGGTVGFTWTHADPYLRGSVMGHPFDWFEASYQYTDVNNYLYSDSPEFSGTQSYKDKSFDAKFRLIKERDYIPQIAVGFRDFGGSALFAAEYIVASKLIGNIDFTLGLGFGTISNRNIANPLAKIDSRFESRDRAAMADTQGGEINYGKFFGGKDAGLFGGVEIYLPKLKGTRLKIEYDTTNYASFRDGGEGYLPVSQDGKFNYSFIYPINENFHVKLGYIRNNTLSFGFSIAGNYSNRKATIIAKKNPPPIIDDSEIYRKVVNAEKAEYLYKSTLKILRDNQIYLRTANVENNRYEVTFSQSKYLNNAQSIGRVVDILNEISPDIIEEFSAVTINADQSLYAVDIPRSSYNLYKLGKKTDALLEDVSIYKPDPKQHLAHDFRPEVELPSSYYKISPAVRSQIGGPDGFYFGDISISVHSEVIIKPNINILAVGSIGLYNGFDELKLASDSILPHVRTDIVSYLKGSTKSHITRLQANYFGNPYKSIYTKLSAGIFEQ
ncbi:YjbH domain-containing protein, partial [Gammaproteobacteria bacterium]|nr:YjbH domain-containing protein [Gammaproteobacteria bacterium]